MQRPSNLMILIAICVALFMVTSVLQKSEAPVVKAQTLPDITFHDIENNRFTIQRFAGKTILLHVWASWCPPCVEEFPALLQRIRDDKNLVLIAVSVDQDKAKMKNFISKLQKKQHDRMKFVWDADLAISKDILGVTLYPETLVVTPDARIWDRIRGATDWQTYSLPKH